MRVWMVNSVAFVMSWKFVNSYWSRHCHQLFIMRRKKKLGNGVRGWIEGRLVLAGRSESAGFGRGSPGRYVSRTPRVAVGRKERKGRVTTCLA